MRAALQPWQQAILHTWFEELGPSDWFASSDAVDAMLRDRFAPGSLEYAQSHHEMIERFGRFPHRNEVLGRGTTAEEQRAIDAGFSW